MLTYLLLIVLVVLIVGVVVAVRRQAKVTRSYSPEEQAQDARVYAESTKAMEATVAEALAQKARDPRLASMSHTDLVYEVLKDCYDPEIPLNVVDLGLIYEVKAGMDAVDVKMSVTSAACPSGSVIYGARRASKGSALTLRDSLRVPQFHTPVEARSHGRHQADRQGDQGLLRRPEAVRGAQRRP